MTEDLKLLQLGCFKESGRTNEASLNAFIGSKADEFIDLKNEVIITPEDYVHKWISGMEEKAKTESVEIELLLRNKKNKNLREYVFMFLRRSFLNKYNELCKKRPETGDAEIWFGVNDAHYGLFVTPRWSGTNWENDKSEIRAVKFKYWTIGHIIHTGVCLPDENEIYPFKDVPAFLAFLAFLKAQHPLILPFKIVWI